MSTFKIFKIAADGKRYAKAAKTVGLYTEALRVAETLPGDRASYKIFELADGELRLVELRLVEPAKTKAEKKASKPKAVVDTTNCTNGHLRAEWWTVTAGGRKYCRKCAVIASLKSKASKKAEKAEHASVEAIEAAIAAGEEAAAEASQS